LRVTPSGGDGVTGTSLMTMPLHAITEIYGEPGLRERFLLEIAVLPPADRDRLLAAYAIADELHRDDRRVREPYVNHLLRVTIRILRYYGIVDTDVLAAALLHDAVEDHPEELAVWNGASPPDPAPPGSAPSREQWERAALGVLAELFNPRVAELVAAVTNPAYDPGRSAHEQYREHVTASLDAHPWARVIKISDFTDNGVGVIYTSGPKVSSSATKYRPLVPILRELVARPDTPLSPTARRHVLGQLDLAEQRFANILDA
jgi:hypothetical protein